MKENLNLQLHNVFAVCNVFNYERYHIAWTKDINGSFDNIAENRTSFLNECGITHSNFMTHLDVLECILEDL